MGQVSTVGLDLAKNIFQAHGADVSGEVVFRKKLGRGRLLAFFAGLHHWWPKIFGVIYNEGLAKLACARSEQHGAHFFYDRRKRVEVQNKSIMLWQGAGGVKNRA
jgi:transposase